MFYDHEIVIKLHSLVHFQVFVAGHEAVPVAHRLLTQNKIQRILRRVRLDLVAQLGRPLQAFRVERYGRQRFVRTARLDDGIAGSNSI